MMFEVYGKFVVPVLLLVALFFFSHEYKPSTKTFFQKKILFLS